MKFLNFIILLWVIFALLVPDPLTRLNPDTDSDPVRIRIRIRIRNPVIVGPESLQHPARFDATENVWVWEYPTEDEDGAATHTDLFMDVGEPVRFRVAGETFTDTGPSSRPDVAPEVLVPIIKNFNFLCLCALK